jgi:hypothetical protein
MSETPSYGQRIKFQKQNNLLVSHKVFVNGNKAARLIIDTEKLTYSLVDPVTGFVLESSTKEYGNLEVVQRNAKKALEKYVGIKFEKEPKRPKATVTNG